MNEAMSAPLRRHEGLFRYSAAHFLAALVALIVASPFTEGSDAGRAIDAVLITLVLALGVLAIGGRRRTLFVAGALAAPAVGGRWLRELRPEAVAAWIPVAFGILLVGYVAAHLLRFVLGARRVDSEVLCAGVANYLLLGVLWAFAYVLVSDVVPDSFVVTAGPAVGHELRGFGAVYFSFVTLSTVGYGDITPALPVARMLAMTEAVAGTFYLALLISRLVALYTSERSPQ